MCTSVYLCGFPFVVEPALTEMLHKYATVLQLMSGCGHISIHLYSPLGLVSCNFLSFVYRGFTALKPPQPCHQSHSLLYFRAHGAWLSFSYKYAERWVFVVVLVFVFSFETKSLLLPREGNGELMDSSGFSTSASHVDGTIDKGHYTLL